MPTINNRYTPGSHRKNKPSFIIDGNGMFMYSLYSGTNGCFTFEINSNNPLRLPSLIPWYDTNRLLIELKKYAIRFETDDIEQYLSTKNEIATLVGQKGNSVRQYSHWNGQKTLPSKQNPTPCQQYPSPYQQNPTPYQQYPTPYQQYPTPYQQYPTRYQQNPTPYKQNPTQVGQIDLRIKQLKLSMRRQLFPFVPMSTGNRKFVAGTRLKKDSTENEILFNQFINFK